MKFRIEDVEVYFPYDYIYPEQLRYMRYLKKSLDVKGGCLLEVRKSPGLSDLWIWSDAHGDWQDHRPVVLYNLVPTDSQRSREINILHANYSRNAEGES